MEDKINYPLEIAGIFLPGIFLKNFSLKKKKKIKKFKKKID